MHEVLLVVAFVFDVVVVGCLGIFVGLVVVERTLGAPAGKGLRLRILELYGNIMSARQEHYFLLLYILVVKIKRKRKKKKEKR